MARERNGKKQVSAEVAVKVHTLLSEAAEAAGVLPAVIVRKAVCSYLGVTLDGEPVTGTDADPFKLIRLPSGMEPEIEQMTALELASVRGMGMALIRAAQETAAARQLTTEVDQWVRGDGQ